MAVYCPMYDSIYGWYILVCGPKGCYKQMIVSPLHYYNAMGVKPPVGSNFTPQDLEDFEADLTSMPLSLSTPGGMSSTYALAVPVSLAPQASGAFGPEFEDLSYLQDPFLLPPVGPPSAYDSLYSSLVSSVAYIPQLPAAGTSSMGSFVPLGYYMDSLSSSANPFGQSLSLPTGSYGVTMADPLATSNANISSNSSLLLPSPVSSGTTSKQKNNNNGQSSYFSKPYSPQSSMSSSFKYKYNNLKPSASTNLSQLSMSSDSKYQTSLQSAFPISNTPPVSSNPKFKNLNPQFSSTSNSKLDYYYPSLPGPSSGKGKVLSSSLGTPYSSISSAANPSNTKNSFASSAMYNDPDMAYEMYIDGVDESILEEEDYDMVEP